MIFGISEGWYMLLCVGIAVFGLILGYGIAKEQGVI